MQTALPLVTAIVSLVFGLTVLDQYFARRRPYQLFWAIGVFLYAIGAGCEFWAGEFGLGQVVFRLWYLSGAILVAAYLGMGTLYLLARRRQANVIMTILVIASLWAIIRVFTANLDLTGMETLAGGSRPLDLRIAAAVFNIFGTITLVGGAIYSAWIFWRRRILVHRMVANILIAVGAILPAIAGISTTAGGSNIIHVIFLLLGIIIIFIGFLRTKDVFGFFRFPLVHGFKKVPNR
jgi:hypothetical protein